MERAYELAARGTGSTAPNPCVGAVVVAAGRIAGEGYHHRAGEPHAETLAVAQAGRAARGATLYVSLEPCAVAGLVGPCAPVIADAGIARVVAGTFDPNPKNRGAGVRALRERGVVVDVLEDAQAQRLVEAFAAFIVSDRPYVALKMAMSLDGAVTSEPAVQEWITSPPERLYVRELRIAYDAVMVGARTVRVDDPQLTVRPAYHRLRPFWRIVVCEKETIAATSRILGRVNEYEPTIVLAPAGLRDRFANLSGVATPVFVGSEAATQLQLPAAMRTLRGMGITSILCEGGPTLGARLIEAELVERFYWAIAPRLLRNDRAVPVLSGVDLAAQRPRLAFDRVEVVGDDVVVSGTVAYV